MEQPAARNRSRSAREVQSLEQSAAGVVDVLEATISRRMFGSVARGLDGIELGNVCAQSFEMQPEIFAQQAADRVRVMNGCAILHHDQVATRVTQQIPEKVVDFVVSDVLCTPSEVQVEPRALGAHQQPADHRGAVTALVVARDKSLSEWCGRALRLEDHHEAGLIDKDMAGTNPRGASLLVAPALALRLFDPFLVTLHRTSLGLLADEAQLSQEPGEMPAMELKVIVRLDQRRHARSGLQPGAEDHGNRTSEDSLHEFPVAEILVSSVGRFASLMNSAKFNATHSSSYAIAKFVICGNCSSPEEGSYVEGVVIL